MIAYVAAAGEKLQVMLVGQFCDKGFVGFRGFSAKPVIEVRNREDDSQLRAKLQQDAQQRDRIRTARNGNTDAFTRVHQLSFPDVAEVPFRARRDGNAGGSFQLGAFR